jgi:hypothetical protein
MKNYLSQSMGSQSGNAFGGRGIRLVLVCAALAIQSAGLFAQDITVRELPDIEYARNAGKWQFSGPRLVQEDAAAGLAKVNLGLHQEGAIVYEFTLRYEGGVEDGHGGAGIHVFADSRLNYPSWGAGKSYLLWLNYDEKPMDKAIPAGLSAQVYRSTSHSDMKLLHSIDLNDYLDFFDDDNLHADIPFRITINGDTGEVRVYDPTVDLSSVYFVFYMDKSDLPMKGDWVSLRTNGVKASFALGL